MDWDVAKQIGEAGEMPYLAPLLEWLGNQTLDGAKVHADFSRKAVMGHSHGGKLAALHYANNSTPGGISTAVLLDPVDCLMIGQVHPSAVAKLLGVDLNCGAPLVGLPNRRSKLAAAVMGAGATSSKCNPNHTSYQSFADVMSLDSWNIRIIKGGHMGFAFSSDGAYHTLNDQCGVGQVPPPVVTGEAKMMAVGWLESVFQLSEDTRQRLAAYKQHLQDQSAAGILTCYLPNRDFFYPGK
ncbi:hypothetical protein Vafri_6057 [Volvox africanus]|nr:hypothetical protein Vafri_6057 [Volvox africanus]